MFPALKNNATAGYKVPVKIEILKGVCLLQSCVVKDRDTTLDM